MIDAKQWEETVGRMAEIDAEFEVWDAIGDFINTNADICKHERNFTKLQGWINARESVIAKMKCISSEYEELIKMAKEA